MPGQTRRPAQAPAQTTAPQTAPSTARAGPAVGNAAAQPQGLYGGIGQAQSALLDQTESASVSVGGMLPGGLLLGERDGNRLSTGEQTSFSVGVSRYGLFAQFNPGIAVRPGGFWARTATGGITITRLSWSFQSGRADLDLDTGMAGDVLDFFFDFKQSIENRFATAFSGVLPARIREPGYDPYTDRQLPTLLQQVVSSMNTAFPRAQGGGAGPNLMQQITQPEIGASFSPKPVRIPLGEKLVLVADPEAWFEITAHLEGNVQTALTSPHVREIDLSSRGISIEHEVAGKIANVDLHSARLGPDLGLLSLDYGLGLESTATALKALGMLFQLRTGQDLGIRDINAVELESVRRMIDQQARARVPDMVREQIRQNDGAIPGFSLRSMFRGV